MVAVSVGGPDGSVVAAVGAFVPSLKYGKARLLAVLLVAARGVGRTLASEAAPRSR